MEDLAKGVFIGSVLALVCMLFGDFWRVRRKLRKRAAEPPVNHGTPEYRILTLPPTGQEVFTPEPLLAGRVYRILLTGTIGFTSTEGVTHHADVFHRQDKYGNFLTPHEELIVGNEQFNELPHILEAADRDAHRYSFLIDGNGEKLSLALRPLADETWGTISVGVELLDPSERSVTLRREGEANRPAIEQIKQQIEKLRVSTEINRNWGDPNFVADVSKSRTASLLQERERIRQCFVALHEENPQLVAYMRNHEPELFARFCGPVEAFLAAERRDAKPPKAAAELRPKEKKQKLTVEQVRERIVRRLTVGEDDQKALLKSKVSAWDEKAALLREAGLEDDEIAVAIGTKVDAISDVLGEFAERKGGSHATSQQLA